MRATIPSFSLFGTVGFFLLYPFFFFYQVSIAKGYIPPVLGGYFRYAVAAVFIASLFFIASNAKKNRIVWADLNFILFVGYFFSVVCINELLESESQYFTWHLGQVLQLLTVFMVFRSLDVDSLMLKRALFVAVILMSSSVFYFSENGFFYLKGHSLNSSYVSTYQEFANAYMLSVMLLVACLRRGWTRLAIYIIAVPSLYLNGSRSELIALILFVMLYEIVLAKHKWRVLFWVGLACAAVVVGIYFFGDYMPKNRVLYLAAPASDGSIRMRTDMAVNALDIVADSPLFGNYGDYKVGEYAHNIISVWVDLGLIGLVIYLGMIISAFYKSACAALFYWGGERRVALILSMLAVAILLVLTSKYFSYNMIAAALGLFSGYRVLQSRRSI